MRNILEGENRHVATIGEARQGSAENAPAYRARLAAKLHETGAYIAWLCVPPGTHVPIIVEAALDAGLHVVVEKPWYGPRAVTDLLSSRANSLRRVIAVHFEYNMLDEVERWRQELQAGAGLDFYGRFFLSRANHTGMPALDNLGSHLLAVRAYAVPQSNVRLVLCGYEQPDERYAWLERDGVRVAFLDFLETKQRIIQRYIARLEASLQGANFLFDLQFAQRVADDTDSVRRAGLGAR